MEQQPTLPEDVQQFIESAIRAADWAANQLPGAAPESWRPIAYRRVLEAILRDRAVNNSEGEITEEDAGYLREMAAAAAQAAANPGTRDPEVTFEVVLQGLLEDWIRNWFGAGDSDDEEDEVPVPDGEEATPPV
ncbi:MAG TPA: hypothetical protein VIA06_05725 [Candidatus Dormibacteraeota bacterium]|jgi:hypothetical protein|nr:hypothetical protein [Candidatus Dormibacteraeota bacterium]